MIYTEFKDVVSTVLKNSEKKGTTNAIHRIICYYFKYMYQGHEIPMVIENYYYNRLFLEIMLAIGKSEVYAEFNDQNMKKFNNLLSKTILTSKINSFKARQKLYFTWIGGEQNYQGQNDILTFLWKCYPLMSDRDEVKKLLGIDVNIEKLKIKLSEVRNGR